MCALGVRSESVVLKPGECLCVKNYESMRAAQDSYK